MRTLTLKLPDTLDQRVRAEASRKETTLSELIRAALEQYLGNDERAPQGSFLERAADLAGCVEGPADLSVAEEHFDGYGC